MLNILALLPAFLVILLGMTAIAALFIILPLCSKKHSVVRSVSFTIILLPIFVMLSGSLYWYWGAPDKILDQLVLKKISHTLKEIHDKPGTKDQLLADFDTLENKIDFSDVGLAHLASMYTELGLYDKSIKTMEKALQLAPAKKEYKAQWIYSHSLRNEGKFSAQIRSQAEVFAKENHSYHVMNLLAIDDYFQENYDKAILGWQFILTQDETLNASRRIVLQNAIRAAEQLKKSKASTQDPLEVVLEVKVSLALSLQTKVSPEDTVFVYVKSADRNGPPLAVIKKQARELPFTVKLDNTNSMISGASLTVAQKVKVLAKISKSGDAFNKTGDLQGNSNELVLKSGTQPLQVTINGQT